MNATSTVERFSPLGTPVVNADGQLLWELETLVFRCRMPASQALQAAVSTEEAVQDPQAQAFFEMLIPKPPFQLLEATVALFREVIFHTGKGTEALVQLTYSEKQWGVHFPQQTATANQVESGAIGAADHIAIEIHSHGTLPAYFSPTDNEDEVDGFLYGVLGNVMAWSPSARFRVGHAGCFLDLDIEQVFELPAGLILPKGASVEAKHE